MRPYPLTFEPLLKEKIWGGRLLDRFGKVIPSGSLVGESWEVADLDGEYGQSVIANGPWRGMALRNAIESNHNDILGSHCGERFPLLIKFLDAHENLSLQVHPSETYAATHPDVAVKHEAWLILHAEPDAVIYLGLKPHVSPEQFLNAIRTGTVMEKVNAERVKPGECYYIPSGTVHALGAGVALAEVQTSSDSTFRIFDWGREQTSQHREMHIEQAMQCIDFTSSRPPEQLADRSPPVEVDNLCTALLADTPHFVIERIKAVRDAVYHHATSGMPEVWMTLSGHGRILPHDQPIVEIQPGKTVLIPAALEDTRAELTGGTSFARVSLPSPLKGKIA